MVSEILSALILAFIQGATEWFPVSSSGHLVLFEKILGVEESLVFDVALHFGTLMAVFVYFGRDITNIVRDFFSARWHTPEGRMALLLIVGSVPAAIVGYFLRNIFDTTSRSLGVVAFGFGITGLFLLITSTTSFSRRKSSRSSENHNKLSYWKAFVVGIAQAFAIVPGISRSGATVSSSILLGLKERDAIKFAFLLSIPIVFGANIVTIGNNTLPPSLIWATLVSFIVGLLSIHVIFKHVLVSRKNLKWFGFYCLLLALVLGVWLLFIQQ